MRKLAHSNITCLQRFPFLFILTGSCRNGFSLIKVSSTCHLILVAWSLSRGFVLIEYYLAQFTAESWRNERSHSNYEGNITHSTKILPRQILAFLSKICWSQGGENCFWCICRIFFQDMRWAEDKDAAQCQQCNQPFSLARRKVVAVLTGSFITLSLNVFFKWCCCCCCCLCYCYGSSYVRISSWTAS